MTITRFAPSPTGNFHIGNLRTALYNYLWSRRNGGKFFLRIEDTDKQRNIKEAFDLIKEIFRWTNLNFDGDIIYQSDRLDIYKSYAQRLLDEKRAYYCYLSKDELVSINSKNVDMAQKARLLRKYRDLDISSLDKTKKNIKPTIRIKSPIDGKLSFIDGVKKRVLIDIKNTLNDFIIIRSDGAPTYNYAAVVDDHLMGITDVIRGEDHLLNTFKQIILYNYFKFPIPKFYHAPSILNHYGKKLSKRDGAINVMDYKKLGFLPQALLNFLVRLGWGYKDEEILSMDRMVNLFNPKDINKAPSVYNKKKLLWINFEYIKRSSLDEIQSNLLGMGFDVNSHKLSKKNILVNSLKKRSKTLLEFNTMTVAVLNTPKNYDIAQLKTIPISSVEIIKKYIRYIMRVDKFSLEEIKNLTETFLLENNLDLKTLAKPLRLFLTGTFKSISIFEIMYTIGKEEIKIRVDKALLELSRC